MQLSTEPFSSTNLRSFEDVTPKVHKCWCHNAKKNWEKGGFVWRQAAPLTNQLDSRLLFQNCMQFINDYCDMSSGMAPRGHIFWWWRLSLLNACKQKGFCKRRGQTNFVCGATFRISTTGNAKNLSDLTKKILRLLRILRNERGQILIFWGSFI